MQALQWFGIIGPPFAWAAQHVAGYAITEAACNQAGHSWSVPVDTATIAVTVVAATIVVLAGLSSLTIFRRLRPVAGVGGSKEPPPKGRLYFLAVVGMTVAPIFLFIVILSGIGASVLTDCQQG